MKLHCDVANMKKVTPFIAMPRWPPSWPPYRIIHCCYQIMSREPKLGQRLVNGLFWSRLSKLITIPDLIEKPFIAMTIIFRVMVNWIYCPPGICITLLSLYKVNLWSIFYRLFSRKANNFLHLGLTPCRGRLRSLCASMTQRAVPAGTFVPGRSNQAGLVEG